MLEIFKKQSDSVLYSYAKNSGAGEVTSWIFTSPETRSIVNDTLVYGIRYTQNLQVGLTKFLQLFADQLPENISSQKGNVLHFLRGGLNFELRTALYNAYGWNDYGSTFLSSQRGVDENGKWFVKEDAYHKVTIEKHAIIFCGDVVATGVTLDYGLEKLTQLVKERGGSIRRFIFFTFGCHKAASILKKYATLWSEIFSDFEGIDLVYLEGDFHLANPETETRIKIYGTDLMHRGAVLAPELIASQYENIVYSLERCAIYDAGSRAFYVTEYIADVLEYWQEVKVLADDGVTTKIYLEERAPYLDIAQFPDLFSLNTVAEQQIQKLKSL